MEQYNKREELTSEMHGEFMCATMSKEDYNVMCAFAAIRGGKTKKEALKRFGLTEKFYDANVDRDLSEP